MTTNPSLMAQFASGTRLGPYEITGPIGAGGMGQVYRARDTRLGRDVVIKSLLPEQNDPDNRQRIEREARAIAALSHPHICTLYDIGTHEGETFLVMELLAGETLAARLQTARGGLPIDDAVTIVAQVAEALASAHRHNLVHRDVKPANIMLTGSGAKLLDFGLARPGHGSATGDTGTQSLITKPHETVGTLAYMAPEQLDGRADERSDVFALGAVLYETLTGRRAFIGETRSAVIAAIVGTDPPPIDSVRPDVPAALSRIVRRCLVKDPNRRWQSALDLSEELRASTASTNGAAGSRRRPAAPWLISAVAIAAAAAAIVIGRPWWPAAKPAARHLAFVAPEGVELPEYGPGVAISPDGSLIAFSTTIGTGRGATGHLFVKRMDSAEVQRIAGTDSAIYPIFSADGKSVAFFANGKLRRWSATSGSVSDIAALGTDGSSGSWGRDGVILFGEHGDQPTLGLRRVRDTGGAVEVLTRPDNTKGEQAHVNPVQLDSGVILFTIRSNGPDGAEFNVASRAPNGDVTTVIPGASLAGAAGADQIVYQTGNALMTATFDTRTLGLSNARRIVDGVHPSRNGASWAIGSEVLVYRGIDPPRRRLVWVDRSGTVTPAGLPVRNYFNLVLSPAGDRAAVAVQQGNSVAVWMAEMRQLTLTQLSTPGTTNPVWSSDGKEIFTTRSKGVAREIIRQAADGSEAPRLVLDTGEQLFVADFVAAHRTLVVMKPTNGNRDIWVLDPSDPKSLRPIVQHPAIEYGGRVSPDGKWMSYFSFPESGQAELYVTPFPAGGPRWQVSRDGAREAVWSRDGGELFFRNGDRMMSARIKAGDRFDWDAPRELFSGAFFAQGGPGNVQYDVAADGRFLMIEEFALGSPPLNVVLGWPQLGR